MITQDPFRHHPGLRGMITPPAESFFREITPARVLDFLTERGLATDWIRSEAEIDALRRATLAGHSGDLWVFAYGSLMWDPAVDFAEVRRARLPGYVRSFCLLDTGGGRGDPEQPGVMAALDAGEACEGLAFRIPEARVEDETRRLWFREMIGHAYTAAFRAAETDHGPITVLAFVADHTAEMIRPDLTRDDRIRFAATGEGLFGTSIGYLESLAAHLEELGIADPEVTDLLSEAHEARAGLKPAESESAGQQVSRAVPRR
jgi:cation transport protein ChaC